MGFRGAVVTVGLLVSAGCAASGASDSASGCPADQTNLASVVADQIAAATVTLTVTASVPKTVPGLNNAWRNMEGEAAYKREVEEQEWRAFWERYVPRMAVLTSAQWVERFPGCFSDSAAVVLLALRDSVANTTEPMVMQNRFEHDALLAALRTP